MAERSFDINFTLEAKWEEEFDEDDISINITHINGNKQGRGPSVSIYDCLYDVIFEESDEIINFIEEIIDFGNDMNNLCSKKNKEKDIWDYLLESKSK